jgi:fatty-acyl-CoA synthase
MRNNGIGSWPARRARTAPDGAAIIHEGRTYSFAELRERSTRLAHALRGLGVCRGDRLGYLGPNHPSYAEALFAAGMLGAVLLPLNTRLAPPEHDYILRDAEPVVLIWSAASAQSVAALGADIPVRHLITLGPASGRSLAYEDLLAGASADPLDEPVALDDLCMIQYTSGTSGRPKGVMLSHGNVTWNCINLLIDVDIATDEVNLLVAPMFHTAGMNNGFLPPFLKGGVAIMMSAWDPDQALDLIERHRVTCMVGVPTMFQTMARSPRWASTDLSSIRSLMCGGAPASTALIKLYHERGLRFLQGYGLTETSPNATFLRPDASGRKAGSAGTPCFFTDLRIVAADGNDAAPGEKGEALLQGPNVTAGYWRLPEATASAFVDGDWLRSGDAALFDEEGYVFIVDRIKDMFISGGENVYPAEVENILYQHPAIGECAVIGIADERWGEVGRAIIVVREGCSVADEELREFASARLAAYKVPKSFVRTGVLPRTASGKLLKRRLVETHGQP